MSESQNIDNIPEKGQLGPVDSNIASSSEVSDPARSVKAAKTPQRVSSSSERQIKFERAQKCLENAALVSKRIKEHRKATAELLGRPFEDDDGGDTASEIESNISMRTGYSVATDTSTTMSVQDALNIPGISESLANTLKQKELLMERIKQYKEISKRPMTKSSTAVVRRESTATADTKVELKKSTGSSEQLLSSLKDKENALSIMQVKMKAMETTILDLQEKINEKDQIIEAKNKATTLISDSLTKKEKDSLSLLEDTRHQMTKMQENFITMETEWKEEKQILLKDLESKQEKIKSLEEANTILETMRFETSIEHSKLLEELELKNKEISQLEERIQNLTLTIEEKPTEKEKQDTEVEKGTKEIENMTELTNKIELLEQLNCQIRQTNKELESKLASLTTEAKPSSPSKKASPLPSRKGRNTAAKQKSPWSNISSESLPQETDKKHMKNEVARLESVVQSLNKDILDKEYALSEKDGLIAELQESAKQMVDKPTLAEACVNTEIVGEVQEVEEVIRQQIMSTSERTPCEEHQSLTKEELEQKLKEAQDQIALLNNEIEAANKNMIKVKSNHKIKIKQMQKTIENFSKVSDANAEVIRLNEELHQLSQKVAEVEEEKGNLQLHLVDYDSGRLTESDIYKKLVEMENLAETRLKSISVLETQKFDLVQELHTLQQKYAEIEEKLDDITQLQTEQVSSEIKSVQLEEQIDKLTASQKELELVIDNLKHDKEQLNGTIKELQNEKDELNHKLEGYIQENMDLTDKLEKLSAEKVSSAESIEIVESLTTQEKLELEEYNKSISGDNVDGHSAEHSIHEDKNIEIHLKQIEELNKRIELFTQEREEVMDKMNKLCLENDSLQQKIADITNECDKLRNNIEVYEKEKSDLQDLNQEVNRQIEELKRERIDIIKETVDVAKSVTEDTTEAAIAEIQADDKTSIEKGMNRTKSVKQLTKEILKLKNTIKEREDEIADCHMKILSLEEQQQKQHDIMKANSSNEGKLKSLMDENQQLIDEVEQLKKSQEESLMYKQSHEVLQHELQKLQHEYSININSRDARIAELDNAINEYEKQIYNYGNTLQQKDKDLNEYINQITKLNDVSQKLKSTIELLEEEKAKDQNAELVKSLNKQIIAYQKKIAENEEKIRLLEEEKAQLSSVKSVLEGQNATLDQELKRLQESVNEKQNIITDLQAQQQKHAEELIAKKEETKERDEEIHEIKLQLRKESIENEKLRTTLEDKEKEMAKVIEDQEDLKQKLETATKEKDGFSEQCTAMENKNRELMEKLKKFAINIKKKAAMYTELENQLIETQNQLESQNLKLEQYSIQIETLPALQEKLKHAEEEINRIQSQKVSLDQQASEDISHLQNKIKTLEEQEVSLNDTLNVMHKDLHFAREENDQLNKQVEALNKKMVEYDVELKNNANFFTKVTSLETELGQKQSQIAELIEKLEFYQQQEVQVQFGHDAKLQERDLYIETLETEINKYKNRIGRLEESVSVMEDNRQSIEKKADQLDYQLQEKEKAYSEYSHQEDELINRLAVLMDHDRVVQKQLHEIDHENKELQVKLQHFNDENQRLRKSLSDIQEYCNTLVDKAGRCDMAESEVTRLQSYVQEIDAQLKKVSQDYQVLLTQKKKEIEELESEFNTQIENAIKDKKVLGEKHEKLCEHVTQLEAKMHEYKNNNEHLNNNLLHLNKIHQELIEKTSSNQQSATQDYTDQYIAEINNLNALINTKNEEITDLSNKMQTLQAKHKSITTNLESQLMNVTSDSLNVSIEMDRVLQEANYYKQKIDKYESIIAEKDAHIKELKEKKQLSFEMNIPKTEGLFISSTIEAVNEEKKQVDISSLESQIVSEAEMNQPEERVRRAAELVQTQSAVDSSGEAVVEAPMVQKKAYDCFKGDAEPTQEADPFNSDEGWGFGESEDTTDVTPGLSHLNEQIQNLTKEKDTLKVELEASNTRLIKALKKLKEFKLANESLSTELRMAQKMSQSSFFESAIEEELKVKVEELEKRIAELNADIAKERKDKESLRKQNDVFNSSIERLTDMKEKLDSEVELWKYKFKEANDKVSTVQWGSEAKDSPKHAVVERHIDSEQFRQELSKIEKENDELQAIIDQLSSENKELLTKNTKFVGEIESLQRELANKAQLACEQCQGLEKQITDLQNNNAELVKTIESLNGKLGEVESRCSEIMQNYDSLKSENEIKQNNLQKENDDLIQKCTELANKIKTLESIEVEATEKIKSLLDELENVKSQLLMVQQQNLGKREDQTVLDVVEKYAKLEEHCVQLKCKLEEANNKIVSLESNNQDLLKQSQTFLQQLAEFNEKMLNLNKENDNLLSTVAELRSSVSSAVDQRGFEIAELWKQHLAQREADFQKIELDLRNQVTASEAKYEQLLDNMQSSSQEETNKMIMMEQVNSIQNKLQDKEEHLRDLQDKYAEVMSQLDMLRSEMQDEKITLENKILEQQEEYEKQIQEIVANHKENSNSYEQAFKNIQLELATSKTNNEELTQKIEDLNQKLVQSEEVIHELNNQLFIKDNEIQQKTHEFTLSFTARNEEFENIRQQLLEYEKKVEELSFEKESELAVLRLKMHENTNYYDTLKGELEKDREALTEELEAKILECTNLNKQIADLNKSLEEDSSKTLEMQEALENQELEIVNLKDEISNLQSLLRASTTKIQKHVSFATDTKPADESDDSINKELLDAVPRAELDLALYMLHQRDVRCEELTMELTQLLEERDTLQLRLSDSLRLNETLKQKCKEIGVEDSFDSSRETMSDLPTFSVEKEFVDVHRGQTSRGSSVSDFDGDKPKLQAKLSELKTVRHSRDVRLRYESEQRQMDMRLLHRDVANLPPEAVEQLNQAHHSMSRDSQSTSTVLLNWLRGKTTPKVVHM